MAELKLGNIKPVGADNIVVEGKYVKGGYVVVANITERDALKGNSGENIIKGSLCYCQEDSKFYQYDGSNWAEANLGGNSNYHDGDVYVHGSIQVGDPYWGGICFEVGPERIQHEDHVSYSGEVVMNFGCLVTGEQFANVMHNVVDLSTLGSVYSWYESLVDYFGGDTCINGADPYTETEYTCGMIYGGYITGASDPERPVGKQLVSLYQAMKKQIECSKPMFTIRTGTDSIVPFSCDKNKKDIFSSGENPYPLSEIDTYSISFFAGNEVLNIAIGYVSSTGVYHVNVGRSKTYLLYH